MFNNLFFVYEIVMGNNCVKYWEFLNIDMYFFFFEYLVYKMYYLK